MRPQTGPAAHGRCGKGLGNIPTLSRVAFGRYRAKPAQGEPNRRAERLSAPPSAPRRNVLGPCDETADAATIKGDVKDLVKRFHPGMPRRDVPFLRNVCVTSIRSTMTRSRRRSVLRQGGRLKPIAQPSFMSFAWIGRGAREVLTKVRQSGRVRPR